MPLPAGATAVYNSSGLEYYRHADWLGNSRLTSTPSRTVSGDVAYALFGETYAQSGSPELSFTGQNPDTNANLCDFMYREYGIQGRWPSPDPLGPGAFNLADPQSLDLYAYVRNNPTSLIDPLGMDECFLYNESGGATPAAGLSESECEEQNGAYVLSNASITVDIMPPPPPGPTDEVNTGLEMLGWMLESDPCISISGPVFCGSSWPAAPSAPQTTGFTLGIRAPGQSYGVCMATNSNNYSISGVFFGGKGQLLAGNDVAQILFGDTSEGFGGLSTWEGGSRIFDMGIGTPMTFGRRTASIISLNLEGTTGRAPMILGKTGAEEIAGWLSGAAELKSAIDVGLTAAEAIGCAIPQ